MLNIDHEIDIIYDRYLESLLVLIGDNSKYIAMIKM